MKWLLSSSVLLALSVAVASQTFSSSSTDTESSTSSSLESISTASASGSTVVFTTTFNASTSTLSVGSTNSSTTVTFSSSSAAINGTTSTAAINGTATATATSSGSSSGSNNSSQSSSQSTSSGTPSGNSTGNAAIIAQAPLSMVGLIGGDDEDDDFLYGTSSTPAAAQPHVSQPKPVENILLDSSGIISQLEAVVAATAEASKNQTQPVDVDTSLPRDDAQDEGDEEGDGEDDSEEEDIEIIMEPTARSLDFRQQRSQQQRSLSTSTPARAPPPSLTTEYNLIQRQDSTSTHVQPPPSQIPSSQSSASQPPAPQSSSNTLNNLNITLDNGVDPSTLPVAKAPPSHPEIDPTVPGMLDGRAIFEVDIAAMTEKPWRRAGSDISDWFNYGFDELSWEAYCYRRREFGEMADNLKVNVLNFSAMPEDQLTALPTDIRQMVMTGATAAMMNGAPNPGMMAPGVMMDMGMMNQMGIAMNGDMMGQQMMPVDQRGMMMQDSVPAQAPMGNNSTPEQGGGGGVPVGMMQDGFAPSAPMGMGMPGDFSMQDQPQMFAGAGIDGQVQQSVTPVGGSRGPTPSYRARGNIGVSMRARGYPPRGRGRGGMYGSEGAPVVARPASPLPPNVPTGPRNQNKYKDRDGNAPAVDGLDYGGDRAAARTPSGDSDERSSSRLVFALPASSTFAFTFPSPPRKRRGSPSMDDRGSKRR
ncbi:hypothetical protein GYMLUDRAFT_234912 [Collybiopsis luxurians FD-317 M1]|nr:hypothetical protein GYMLUDRAFT_234912 [Collybiopsis luxurians FD-317 M1]